MHRLWLISKKVIIIKKKGNWKVILTVSELRKAGRLPFLISMIYFLMCPCVCCICVYTHVCEWACVHMYMWSPEALTASFLRTFLQEAGSLTCIYNSRIQ